MAENATPKTPRKLLLLKICIVSINLIVAAISVASLYTVATGSFQVILPDEKDIDYRMEGDTAIFSTKVRIMNYGFYDVKDLSIDVLLRDENYSFTLIDESIRIKSIPAHEKVVKPIKIHMNISKIVEEGGDYLIFNDTLLSLAIDVKAFYTLGLIKFYADYTVKSPWEAPIKEILVDERNITFAIEGYRGHISVPYTVDTASWLGGNVGLKIDVVKDGKVITTAEDVVPLGTRVNSHLNLTLGRDTCIQLLLQNAILHFFINATVEPSNAHFTRYFTHKWSPPLRYFELPCPLYNLSIPSRGVDISYEGNGINIALPFGVELSEMFTEPVNLTATLKMNGRALSQDTKTIQPGKNITDAFSLTISDEEAEYLLTHSEDLDVEFNLSSGDKTFGTNYTYLWGAPLEDLNITYVGDKNVTLRFNNTSPNDMILHLNTTAYKNAVEVGNATHIIYAPSNVSVNDTLYMENISDVPTYITVEVYDEESGLSYVVESDVDGG